MIQPEKPKGSRTAKVTAIIGNDYYDLKLDFGCLEELEEKTDRGCYYILRRMTDFDQFGLIGDFKLSWITDIIRIGLVGGGSMSPREAVKFTDRHLRDAFVMDYLPVAVKVLDAGIHGPTAEPVVFDTAEPGEPEPEADVTPTPSADMNGENTGNSPEPSGSTLNPSEG